MGAVTERPRAIGGPPPASSGPIVAGSSPSRRVGLRARGRAGRQRCWDDRRLGVGLAFVVVVSWATVVGWWTPRGPLTTGAALASLGASAIVGFVVGHATRSRWAMLAAPLVFVAAVEVLRVDLVGPTVDRPALTTYGLLALLVGRGFHGLVALVPLAWGAAVGAGAARRWSAGPTEAASLRARLGLGARRSGAVLVGAALAALSLALVRPASTSPIEGPGGEVRPGSVAELTSVRLNGRDQPLLVRGHDRDNPVLLFLAGGPGGSEMGAMRRHLPALEEHFTVVTWDQRGTGKAYPGLDPTGTVTLDGYVADTLAVTDHLRERFGQERIYLVGQSWGSTLGVLVVQRAPERYAAFVGVGQMVSQRETDTVFYQDTLAWAQRTGRRGLAADLLRIGPPPYRSMLDYETALSSEHDVYPYDHSANAEGRAGFSENFVVPEYSLIEQVHLLAGFMDTFAVLYPQLQDIDFRQTATELAVPVFFVQGAHEALGRSRPFEEWFALLRAPMKEVTYFDTSGHRPMFEQPQAFVDHLVGTVLARTEQEG